jgi:hypothetical protein
MHQSVCIEREAGEAMHRPKGIHLLRFVDRLSAAHSTLVRKNSDKRCALSAFSLYPVDDGAAAPNPAGIEN